MKKIVLAIVLIGMLAACSYPQPTTSPSDSATQVALFAQATLTKAAVIAQAQQTSTAIAIQPTNTATNIPATATSVPPTATSIPPTATNVPTVAVTPIPPTSTTAPTSAPGQAIRLSFAAGTTNTTGEGQLSANTIRRYVFWADKNQLMDISLYGASGAYIAITSASGTKLVDFSQGWTWYRDYIPEKGDWYIDIKAGKYDTGYSLYLGIPQRLSFAANATSLTAKATVLAGRVHNFIVWGNKGQTLEVSVSPSEDFWLSIWHVDGTVLLSSMGELSSFEGVLPEAGDYIINVISGAATPTQITLTLSIE